MPPPDACDVCGRRDARRICPNCGLRLCEVHRDCPECDDGEPPFPEPTPEYRIGLDEFGRVEFIPEGDEW